MKRLSTVVLSTVILLALTGCNNGADSESLDESSFVTSQQSSDIQSETVSDELSEVSDISSIAEEISEPTIVTGSNGETIELSGTPSEPVSEFNYDKFLEKWEDDIENRKPNELAELLDGLGKPEVKEVYIKARAILDGFYADGYLSDGAMIDVKSENGHTGFFCETAFTYDSFIKEMHGIFGERVTEEILKDHPLFYEYGGRLWQESVYPGGGAYLTEYRLVQNLDELVEFNAIVYCNYDMPAEFDPDKMDTYRRVTISNRIVKTPDGWRVENCQMFSDVSALGGEENVKIFNSVAE